MTTYPAYRHGLTIEKREGDWCVTNDFGGHIRHRCDGLADALDMRERAAFGCSDEVLAWSAHEDARKNQFHAAHRAIIAEFGEEPFLVRAHHPDLIRYSILTDFGQFWGEDYDSHAVALERLLDSLREASGEEQSSMRAAE